MITRLTRNTEWEPVSINKHNPRSVSSWSQAWYSPNNNNPICQALLLCPIYRCEKLKIKRILNCLHLGGSYSCSFLCCRLYIPHMLLFQLPLLEHGPAFIEAGRWCPKRFFWRLARTGYKSTFFLHCSPRCRESGFQMSSEEREITSTEVFRVSAWWAMNSFIYRLFTKIKMG